MATEGKKVPREGGVTPRFIPVFVYIGGVI